MARGDVITDHGNVHAEHVVNAGGLWRARSGGWLAWSCPSWRMEHQYLITEKIPSLAPRPGYKEQLHCIDFEGEIYLA